MIKASELAELENDERRTASNLNLRYIYRESTSNAPK